MSRIVKSIADKSSWLVLYLAFIAIFIVSCAPVSIQHPATSTEKQAIQNAEGDLAAAHYNQARYEFSEFVKNYPKSKMVPDALYRIAYIDVINGDYKTAHSGFSSLLKKFPKCRWAFSAKLWQRVTKELGRKEQEHPSAVANEAPENDSECSKELQDCQKEKDELKTRVEKLEKIMEGMK